MSVSGSRLRIYWPEENIFTDESPADVDLYEADLACQPHEVAA